MVHFPRFQTQTLSVSLYIKQLETFSFKWAMVNINVYNIILRTSYRYMTIYLS